MPTRTFKKALIGKQDLNVGSESDTFTRTTSTGGTQTFNKIPIGSSLTGIVNVGTTSGLVTPPTAAPTLNEEAGGSNSAQTVYIKYTLVNLNGETTGSSTANITTTGASKLVGVALAGSALEWTTGAYGYRVYASSDNVNFYRQTCRNISVAAAADGTNMVVSSATRTTNIVQVVCSASLGTEFQVGRPVVISGCDASFNGTFPILSIGGDGAAAAVNTTFSYYSSGGNGASGAVGNARVFSACCDGTTMFFRTAAHSLQTGKSFTTTGYGNASFNGTFTVKYRVDNTCFAATSAVASAQTNGGTVAYSTGLSSDNTVHWVTGTFLIDTLTFSGTAIPTTNTATIDPIQVSLNSISSVLNSPNGILSLGATTYTLTTPLICSNQQKILGTACNRVEPSGAVQSRISASIANIELAAVMVTKASAFCMEGVTINNTGHPLMVLSTATNHVYRNNSFRTSSSSGLYSAVRITAGTAQAYSLHFEDNYLSGDLSCVYVTNTPGGMHIFENGRWDCGSYNTYPCSNAFLNEGGADDFDRNARSNGGTSSFCIRKVIWESARGAWVKACNTDIQLIDVQAADPSTLAMIPAAIEICKDSFTSSDSIIPMMIKGMVFQASSNHHASLAFTQNTNPINLYISDGCNFSNTRAINLNNLNIANVSVDNCPAINFSTSASSGLIVNYGLPNIHGDGAGDLFTAATQRDNHHFRGGIWYSRHSGTAGTGWHWGEWINASTYGIYANDPSVATNLTRDITFNSGFGERTYQNDGATIFHQLNAQAGANQINFHAPSTLANNKVNFGKTVGVYANIATVGQGIPAEYATIDLTAQTAAKTATLLYAVPAAGQGIYRVSWVATITTAATTSSILGGTNGFQVQFTSPTDSVVKTSNPSTTTGFTSAANTTGTTVSGCFVAYAKASTNINYLFDYTSVGGTPMAYELHIRCEAL